MGPLAGPAPRLSRRHLALALAVAAGHRLRDEWQGSAFYRWIASRPRPRGLAAAPKDFRPADAEAGRRILAGAFVLAGTALAVGPRGDPWDRPSPSRRFAVILHRFDWLRDLLAAGDEGAAEALRLTLEWRRLFGRWNGFAWAPEVLERRVFNLACGIRAVCAGASDAEAALIQADLARQARYLLDAGGGPARAAERACAAGIAGAALAGPAGERLMDRALKALEPALEAAVPPEGGHATRNPQAALELLFDLATLDEALTQRGLPAPEGLLRGIDRLAAAVRFFTLRDGRLAAFQGGDEMTAPYVAAARAQDELGERPTPAERNGYHRLDGHALQVIADAAPPAKGPWSLAACAQPLAIEVLANGRRLVVSTGWSPDAHGPHALRVADGASTACLSDASCGEPLRGFSAQVLGPRLVDAYEAVEARRHEAPGALWLELSHDGWLRRFGLLHERRLYLDLEAEELRGEDRFTAPKAAEGEAGRRFYPFTVRFHLHPEVSALPARDGRSVLLKPEGDETGWWLRTDALSVAIEPSVHFSAGEARRSQQIVLTGQARADTGARLRWKLSSAKAAAAEETEAAAEPAEAGNLL